MTPVATTLSRSLSSYKDGPGCRLGTLTFDFDYNYIYINLDDSFDLGRVTNHRSPMAPQLSPNDVKALSSFCTNKNVVVLPTYEPGSMDDEYYKNCQPFIVLGVVRAEVFRDGNPAVTTRGGVTIQQPSPFFLWKEELGHGTFGRVFKVQRLPDGKIFAAKFLRRPDPKETTEIFSQGIDTLDLLRTELVRQHHSQPGHLDLAPQAKGKRVLTAAPKSNK